MALINSTDGFCAEDLNEFYSTSLLQGVTVGAIRVIPNVKNSVKLASFDWGSVLQEADCDFTDGNGGTLDQKTLSVCPVKINESFCLTTVEATFLAKRLRAGSNTGEVLPGEFEAYVLSEMSMRVQNDIENLIWKGDVDGSPASLCDGFLKLMTADTATLKVTGTTLSASNIIAELTKVYNKIPSTIVFNTGDAAPKIFISPEAARFYQIAQGALTGNNNAGYDASKMFNFLGIELVVTPGLSGTAANKMVAAIPSNLWFGTDLISDFDDTYLIDMSKTTGAKQARLIGGLKLGVNYGVSAEVVLYA